MQTDPTILSLAVNAVTAALAWVTGEAGRIAIAGGAGGLSRWFTAEKRNIRVTSARDAYAVSHDYTARAQLHAITIHRRLGEIEIQRVKVAA